METKFLKIDVDKEDKLFKNYNFQKVLIKQFNLEQSFGLEVELICSKIFLTIMEREYYIPPYKWLIDNNSTIFKILKEYYSNQIEFNFPPFNDLSEVEKINKTLTFFKKKFKFNTNGDYPYWVGTHCHLFGFDYKTRDKLLEGILFFIWENRESLSLLSIKRLLCGHQIWGYLYWNDKEARNVFEKLGLELPEFSNKPKYHPLPLSPYNSVTNKPESLEIRIIPNEFILQKKGEKLKILLEKIQDGSIYNNLLSIKDFLNKLNIYYNNI